MFFNTVDRRWYIWTAWSKLSLPSYSHTWQRQGTFALSRRDFMIDLRYGPSTIHIILRHRLRYFPTRTHRPTWWRRLHIPIHFKDRIRHRFTSGSASLLDLTYWIRPSGPPSGFPSPFQPSSWIFPFVPFRHCCDVSNACSYLNVGLGRLGYVPHELKKTEKDQCMPT